MDKKPRIGVDCDGVLGDFIKAAVPVIEKRYGVTFDHSKHVSWDLDHLIPEGKISDFWEHIGEIAFHEIMEPFEAALKDIPRLKKVADVYVVTAHLRSGKTWVYDRDRWLQKHFGFKRGQVVHTVAKHTFKGVALVDDKPENVKNWQEDEGNESHLGILWSQPYNQTGNARLVAKNWDQVISAVETIRTYGTWSPGR